MDKLISLCMIVKDEERVLARCLDSVKGLVDEIIIVDTGSTDRTKEIASKYTDHVYDYTWSNDFAAARNESIRRATSEWILVLDADEYVQQAGIESLRTYLINKTPSPYTVLMVPIINYLGSANVDDSIVEATVARVFKAGLGTHYTKPIHEQITNHDHRLQFVQYPLRLYHTGYTEQTRKAKNKSERNLQILERLTETSASKPVDYFSLGNEYASILNHTKAIEYYRRAFKGAQRTIAWYDTCLVNFINSLIYVQEYHEAWELIENYLIEWDNSPDYLSAKGTVLYCLGFYDVSKDYFHAAVQAAETAAKSKDRFWLVSPDYAYKIPYQMLEHYYDHKQDTQQIVLMLIKILQGNPYQYQSLSKLISLLIQREDTQSIINLLERIYSNDVPKDILYLFQATFRSGDTQLSTYYMNKLEATKLVLPVQNNLLYAVLLQDQQRFDRYRELLPEHTMGDLNQSDVMPYLLAALLWKQPMYIPMLSQDHSLFFIRELIIQTLEGESVVITPSKAEVTLLFDLLTSLFTYKLYDAYDQLLQRISSAWLINLLADYYYQSNRLELALDYYSLLLDAGELRAQGYVNLAFLHYNQGAMDEGLAFMQQAIELQPNEIALYTVLCTNTQDHNVIETYKQKLFDQFPGYKDMELFRSL
ncbi:glycosyltransferase [Paenibacillus albiflavus]|uniref:Glycosyltransferase n=1 Tax=Paenibacillus albiflavus TaxID=2545760 RepID=A0A4R4ECH0_9BACL|nr:glycosyltransferase family 2 protein [Paenibacillus albiflavus]TCZ76853.1 glycosyltransferase [Paenibacillus albiflavus]